MRIVVHDFAGHPFQVELSRELSRRGHIVLHLHCIDYLSGKGALHRTDDDPTGFGVEGVSSGEAVERHSLPKRIRQERKYAVAVMRRIERFSADLVISSNNPLFAQRKLLTWCRESRIPFIFWQQDIYSLAMQREAARRLPGIGHWLGSYFVRLERRTLRASSAVVPISADFLSFLDKSGVSPARVRVVENWAPLAELPVSSRDNPWARRHHLVDRRVLLYAGTLGRKHDPSLLLALARSLRGDPDALVVVISEGEGVDALRAMIREEGVTNIEVLPFQPYEDLPNVLGAADVLIAILEQDAGVFSVPSKVLTYHCAGRPILAAVPASNLAATTILRAGSGLVVSPIDREDFVNAGRSLLLNESLRRDCGKRARSYAEQAFNIEHIATEFEQLAAAVSDEQADVVADATVAETAAAAS